jgi:hypothetical protein
MQTAEGERELVSMSRGFILVLKDRAPRPDTNVRDDTLRSSAFWKESFEKRPASSFCEPNSQTSNVALV